MKLRSVLLLLVCVSFGQAALRAQEAAAASFDDVAGSVQARLEAGIEELNAVRRQVAEETIPLGRELSRLEGELSDVRLEYQKTARTLDSRTLDLTNIRQEIESRGQEASYLSNLLGEYIRNFESRLHIAELQRFREPLDAAKLAAENTALSEAEVFAAQIELLEVSLGRLEDALGGTRFDGTAVNAAGMVKPGTFAMVGPAAIFVSKDGGEVGTAEQRLGSLEPAVIAFATPEDALAASMLVADGAGAFPLDPTFGNAHKVEATRETFAEHVRKGGPVMYPIFGIAGAALLVALFKWISMSMVRNPSDRQIRELLEAVARRDAEAFRGIAAKLAKPGLRPATDWMLGAGAGAAAGAAFHWATGLQSAAIAHLRFADAAWTTVAVFAVAGGAIELVLRLLFGHSPVGRMLAAGIDHVAEPAQLIEEIMYERVLATRLKLQSLLPFVALTASSAPLLGLLGTVTGIMNTFSLMTVFGTGDVKTLSSGISEALITTEFGLYVAIPSLLLYAFLSRKARGVVDRMEKAAVALLNQIGKTPQVDAVIEELAEPA